MNNYSTLTLPNVEFYVINYPLIVNNEQNALNSLGGVNTISKILTSNLFDTQKKRIPLYLRPNMIYAKPLLSEYSETKGVLMKLRQLRNKTTGELKLVPEILGYVKNMYEYNALCDYQYNPHSSLNDSSPDDPNVFYDKLLPNKIMMDICEFDDYMNSNKEIFLPPLIFTKFEKPAELRIKVLDSSKGVVKKKDFKIETQMTNSDLLNELFSIQPIWTSSNLNEAILETNHSNICKVRELRSELANHMSKGPWRRTWIRKDYDHEILPESRMFQIFEFRANTSHINVIKKYLRSSVLNTDPIGQIQPSSTKIGPKFLPATVNCFYQLCHVDIPEVRELLSNESIPPAVHAEYGWFSPDFGNKIKAAINKFISEKVEFLMKLNDGNLE